MPELRALHAIRYDFSRFRGDVGAVLAPPYDVLDQGDKDELLAKSENNIVALDLPHLPPKTAGPSEVYDRAARHMNEWLESGVLIREQRPALYAYHQVFQHAGETYKRRMLIARLRLEPFEKGVILPHEKTFGGPKGIGSRS